MEFAQIQLPHDIEPAQWVQADGEVFAIGYMSALTHDFMGKALEIWRQTSPGIVVDCIEMDTVSQERALIEGRIAVGILVPSDRPVLELLRVQLLVKYPQVEQKFHKDFDGLDFTMSARRPP